MTLQEAFDRCISEAHTPFWLSFTNQGDTDHAKILPDILLNWKASHSEPHHRPMMYPQPEGGRTFDAEQDLCAEERIADKPLSETEKVDKVKQYIIHCQNFYRFHWQVTECARAGVRVAERLNLQDDQSALLSFLGDSLRRGTTILDAAIVAAGRIRQAAMALPAPEPPTIDREAAVTRLTDIRARVLTMRGERLQDRDEMHARLRIQQAQAAKVYALAAHAGLLSIMPTLPPFDMPDDHFVWVWRKLAQAMHAKHPDRIPALEPLAEADSMPEWLNHAEQLIGALIDLLRDAQDAPEERVMLSPADQAKAMGLTSRNDDEHRANLKFVARFRAKLIKKGGRIYCDDRGNLGTYVSDQDWLPIATAFKQANKGDRNAAADKVMEQQPRPTDGRKRYYCNSCGDTFFSDKPQCTRSTCGSNNVELHRPAAGKRN